MAKPKKKKSSAKKSAARKTRPARKVHAKKAASKRSARGTKPARRSTKSRQQRMESPAILLGLNHSVRKIDPLLLPIIQKLSQPPYAHRINPIREFYRGVPITIGKEEQSLPGLSICHLIVRVD